VSRLFLVYWRVGGDLNLWLDGRNTFWVMTLKAPVRRKQRSVLKSTGGTGNRCQTRNRTVAGQKDKILFLP